MQKHLMAALLAGLALAGAGAAAQDQPRTMEEMTAFLAAHPPATISAAKEASVPMAATGSAGTEIWMTMFGQCVVRT
jgi:hypothetical protein